jgi:hypothetical protein
MSNATDDLQQFLDNLTPEERNAIASASAEDWMSALSATVKSPEFWQSVGISFVNGFKRGIDNYLSDR